jgi:hypothetical protein
MTRMRSHSPRSPGPDSEPFWLFWKFGQRYEAYLTVSSTNCGWFGIASEHGPGGFWVLG